MLYLYVFVEFQVSSSRLRCCCWTDFTKTVIPGTAQSCPDLSLKTWQVHFCRSNCIIQSRHGTAKRSSISHGTKQEHLAKRAKIGGARSGGAEQNSDH